MTRLAFAVNQYNETATVKNNTYKLDSEAYIHQKKVKKISFPVLVFIAVILFLISTKLRLNIKTALLIIAPVEYVVWFVIHVLSLPKKIDDNITVENEND